MLLDPDGRWTIALSASAPVRPVGKPRLRPSTGRASPERRLQRPLRLSACRPAPRRRARRGRRDQDRARAHPDAGSAPSGAGRLSSAARHARALASRSRSTRRAAALRGAPCALLEHRRDPQRRAEHVRVGDRPAARVRGIGQAQRPDDRQPAARGGGGGGADVGDEPLVEQHELAVELERLARRSVQASCSKRPCACISGVKQPNCDPAQRAAPAGSAPPGAAEIAADVVRPVREAARRGGQGRGDQRRAATRSPRPGRRPRASRSPAGPPSPIARRAPRRRRWTSSSAPCMVRR